MKALIYQKFGTADVLEWTDWPNPEASAGSLLVRAAAGGVNPKDILLRKGKFSKTLARDPLPRVSGLDAAGTVAAVGQGVDNFTVGDRVFGMTNTFSGGVHAEVAKFHRDEICHAPSGIRIEEAACVPLAAQTALQALRDCCRIERGRKVLINGASGGVGHFAVQIAKALGAEVHAVCSRRNLSFVTSIGADAAYDYAEQPAPVIALSFDAVFDVFGKFTRSAFSRQLGKRGIYVSTVPKPAAIWPEALARMGISGRSRLVWVRSRTTDLQRIRQWIEDGRVVPHLEKAYPADRAAEAHRHLETKHTRGKVCIVLSG